MEMMDENLQASTLWYIHAYEIMEGRNRGKELFQRKAITFFILKKRLGGQEIF